MNATLPRVLYVLKRFPQVSQTFVIRELLELEALGLYVGIDALAPEPDAQQHVALDDLQADVRYLVQKPKLRNRRVWTVHARVAVRRPGTWLRVARRARHGDWRRFVQAGLVADRIRREGFGHVHAHFANAAVEVARDAAALAGITYSVTAHAKDIFHTCHAEHLTNRIQHATQVVTVSEFNVNHLRNVAPGMSIVHIPNGVPLAEASGPTARGPVLCVARLVEKKGVDLLLRAVALLDARCAELRVEIVGAGDQYEALCELSADLGVNDRVTFRGSLPFSDVQIAYRTSSMLVLPCRVAGDGDRDGLPTVIVEAMARALPVISTDIIGIPEVVIDRVTGLLVPPEDPRRLADAIECLWVDADLGTRLGLAARKLVADRFDPRRSAHALCGVFAAAAR